MKRLSRLLPLAAAAALLCGCEFVSNDDEAFAAAAGGANARHAAQSSSIVGTWFLREKSGSGSWYVFFNADGSWYIKDTPSASRTRVSGTYKTSGTKFSGPMKNPGVGTGEISGTFSGNSMDFTFVEFWHDPHKTILYKGERK